MLKVKADILPFLILTYLIFAEKIMIVNTCLIGAVKYYREKYHMTVISAGPPAKILLYILYWWAVIWRSISSDVWRRIVLELKKLKYLNTLGNEFPNGKSDNIALPSFYLNC